MLTYYRTRGERLSNLGEKNDELISKLDSLGAKFEEKEKVVSKLQEEVESLQAANQSLEQDTEIRIQDLKKQVEPSSLTFLTCQNVFFRRDPIFRPPNSTEHFRVQFSNGHSHLCYRTILPQEAIHLSGSALVEFTLSHFM